MESVLSFKERGVGGDPRYRGNCSPNAYKELFNITNPKTFCDVMSGSGSALDAAQHLGIEAWGFDLKDEFDAVRMDVLEALGQEVDLVTSHPPYWDIIRYSGEQWGEPHPADLSREDDIDVFYDYIQSVLLNQRRATRRGGHYATIIGDVRRKGEYHSLQAELLTRMRRDELAAVLIKAQHNVRSQDQRTTRCAIPESCTSTFCCGAKSRLPPTLFRWRSLKRLTAALVAPGTHS